MSGEGGGWNNSPVVKRWILIGAAFVLALVFVACLGGRPGNAATGSGDGAVIPAPLTLDVQGTPLLVRGAGPCWVWNPGWQVVNGFGKVMYRWAIDVEWCANSARTKVVDVVYHHCLDTGGYFAYDGCTKDHGKTGYSYWSAYDLWHYHFVINGLMFKRTPSVDFQLHDDGHITGTVYYDN